MTRRREYLRAALGALLVFGVVLFPVWQASMALIFVRNVQGHKSDSTQEAASP